MQDLMVVGFIVDEILRVRFKNDKVTRARNIGQGHYVNEVPSRDIEEKSYAWFDGCRLYS